MEEELHGMEGPFFFVAAPCWSCKRVTTFDPARVPSMPLDRHREIGRASCRERV